MKWNSIGAFGYLGLHALSIVVIARLAGAEAVGVFLLAQAVGFPLSRLCGLNYHDINATETGISGFRQHVFNVTVVALPATSVVIILWLLLTDGLLHSAGPPLIVAQMLQAYAQIAQGRFIRLRAFRRAASYEIARGASSVVCFGTGILWLQSLSAAAWLLVSMWIALVMLEIRDARRLSILALPASAAALAKPLLLRERLRYAFSDSVMGLQASSIRLFVGALLGEVAVGVFGATALLTRLIQPAAIACSKTFLPRLADGLARNDADIVGRQYGQVRLGTLAMMVAFTLAGYWLAPPLIDLLLGSELRPSPLVAALIMSGTAPVIGSRFLIQILIAQRQRRAVERASWGALLSSVLLAPPLILGYGLAGAAACLSITFALRYLIAAQGVKATIHGRSLPLHATPAVVATPPAGCRCERS